LGPASLRPKIVRELDERGVSLFRINLSHTPSDAVESTIDFVQQHSTTLICLDTEGAQVRTAVMAAGVVLRKRQRVKLASEVIGAADVVTLRPAEVFSQLTVGSILNVDFHGAALRVTRLGARSAEAVVVEGGRVGSNKAVTVDPPAQLPPFTDHDVRAIELGARKGIRHVALSFASGADDVDRLRGLVPPETYVISKIESRAGIQNVEGIANASDAVLIDRGDLSREVPIEHVPLYQKHIVRCANACNKPVFVATNLLESMVTNGRPTLAEANDIINTLVDGAHGLVLAAETAIGRHPVKSVDMVARLIRAFEDSIARPAFEERLRAPAAGM
jgi:pyruvate kinase